MYIYPVTNSIMRNNLFNKKNETDTVKTGKSCVEYSSEEIKGKYNIAFSGLLSKNLPPIDARNTTKAWRMVPREEYLISEDSSFMLGELLLELDSPYYQNVIRNLKDDESFIIGNKGKDTEFLQKLKVDKKHLLITKKNRGRLYAKDMGSAAGTIINPNVEEYDEIFLQGYLPPGKKCLLPVNGVIALPSAQIPLIDFQNLKEGYVINIGRNKNNNIVINNPYVSDFHCQLQKHKNGIIVKDLNSTNGTKYLGIQNIKSNESILKDNSKLEVNAFLESNIPVLLPKNCQICLGYNPFYTIDTRNENLLNLLERKDTVIIGKAPNCDYAVTSDKYSISDYHLKLQKFGERIIATNLSDSQDTLLVPQKQIKAFYENVENIQFGQNNVGDCYLIASLYALSRNPYGARILKNMVKVLENGVYRVRFANGRIFDIRPDELDGQKQKNGKAVKQSVAAEAGIRAIERAYGKMVKSSMGDTMFLDIDFGGCTGDTIYKIAGIKGDYYKTNSADFDNKLYNIAFDDPKRHILTCTTPILQQSRYMDPMYRFISNHAYAIKKINPMNNTIVIVNPHNTKKEYVISWQEFKKYFDRIIDSTLW